MTAPWLAPLLAVLLAFWLACLDPASTAAFAAARRDGKRGAVVLLSPAAASFDQYDDFEERGRDFRRIVEALEAAR